MTLSMSDVLFIAEQMSYLQEDQVQNVHDGSEDPEDFSQPGLREIITALTAIFDQTGADVEGEIAHATKMLTLLEGDY